MWCVENCRVYWIKKYFFFIINGTLLIGAVSSRVDGRAENCLEYNMEEIRGNERIFTKDF